MAGATAGLADASARPHAAGHSNDRILHIEVTRHGSPPDFRQVEREYFTATTRYLQTDDYSGRRLDYRTWQKDDLDTKHRFVDRVLVTPGRKDWYEETKTVPSLPPHSLGIRSTTERVAHAINVGKAHEEGLTRRDGQRVRLLTLELGKHVGSAMLWVNPSTDQPVSELVGFLQAGGRSRTVRSDWEAASPQVVARLEAKPEPPAGYQVSRVHRNGRATHGLYRHATDPWRPSGSVRSTPHRATIAEIAYYWGVTDARHSADRRTTTTCCAASHSIADRSARRRVAMIDEQSA